MFGYSQWAVIWDKSITYIYILLIYKDKIHSIVIFSEKNSLWSPENQHIDIKTKFMLHLTHITLIISYFDGRHLGFTSRVCQL